jgi:flagellar hook assembly protein FlgD
MSTRGNPSAGGAAQVLAFNVPRESRVTLRVYDVTGGLVTTLLDRDVAAGAHQVAWLGRDDAGRTVPAGLYVAEVVAGADRAVTKLSRLR